MSKDITKYPGEKINVEWDGRLCIHIGECGYSAGDLFVGGRDPWCKPDLTSVDDVVDVESSIVITFQLPVPPLSLLSVADGWK